MAYVQHFSGRKVPPDGGSLRPTQEFPSEDQGSTAAVATEPEPRATAGAQRGGAESADAGSKAAPVTAPVTAADSQAARGDVESEGSEPRRSPDHTDEEYGPTGPLNAKVPKGNAEKIIPAVAIFKRLSKYDPRPAPVNL